MNAANTLRDPNSTVNIKIEMPEQEDNVVTGSVSNANVTADAVSTVRIDAPIPPHMRYASNDVVGLLPLHVTFNLKKSNRYVTQKWDALLDQWKRTGDIMDSFFGSFRLHMYANDGTDVDLSQWLRDQGLYARNVKVFMDEEKECITVSLITMLVDSKRWAPNMTLLSDKTTTTDRKYLTIWDGNRNDRWDMTLYVSYIEQQTPDPGNNTSGEGGGGGGCNAGLPLAVGMIATVLLVLGKRKESDER